MDNWWQNKYEKNNNFIKTFTSWEGKEEYKKILYQTLVNLECKSILNCGCGTGKDFITFKELFKSNEIKIQGIENSDFMVKKAEKLNLPVVKGDIRKINFNDNHFDASIVIDVFEHINDISIVLSELIRVSKKSIIISFFKPPIEENTTLILNKHINNRDKREKCTLTKDQLFITENPGWRGGFTRGCFYNYHNKNIIEKWLSCNEKIYEHDWIYTDNINLIDENNTNIKDYKNCYLFIKLK